MFKSLREDIEAVKERDPAAQSRLEILLCYPGIHALIFHRLAHACSANGFRLVGRFFAYLGRMITGIEIDPDAKIGRRVFIDHGMGVVIGQTAEIGDDCTLYQGVTLGGTELHNGKRHPTLEAGVVVGAGAKILGPFTVGKGAKIGSNAVVVHAVPAGATMVGIPARAVGGDAAVKADTAFLPYGTPCDDESDPVARSFQELRAEIASLRGRIAAIETPPRPNGEVVAFGDRETRRMAE